MRILFTVWPNPAHLYPLVPLAWALSSAGHEVCVASHPLLAESIQSVGLTPVSLGDRATVPPALGPGRPQPLSVRTHLEELTARLDLPAGEREPWDVLYQFMLPSAWDFHPVDARPSDPHPVADALVEFTKEWKPDLVLWDPCFPAAAVAARVAGSTHARFLWGLDYWGWTIDRFSDTRSGSTAATVENPITTTIAPFAERHGVDVDEEILLGQWTVDPTPRPVRLSARTTSMSIAWVPFADQRPRPDWLRRWPERPTIALSLGLSQRMYLAGGWDHVPSILDMLGTVDADVVATLNAAQIGDATVPENVRTIDYLPLSQLLPSCSAVVHHGGMGTFAAASAFGVPQLITDSDADQGMITITGEGGSEWSMAKKHIESTVTANCVTARRAGVRIDIAEPSVDTMRTQLLSVLHEGMYLDGATRLRREIRSQPTPADAVPALERLASGG